MDDLWWSARDDGAGGCSVVFFATKEEAEKDQENEYLNGIERGYGFAEPCFGKVPENPNGEIDYG